MLWFFAARPELSLQLLSADEGRLANGVYLYVVAVRDVLEK